MKKFADLAGQPHKIYWHAECHALYKSLRQDNQVHSLVVTRYNAEGRFRNAKPCPVCMQAIKFFGVKEVHYSTDQGMKILVVS